MAREEFREKRQRVPAQRPPGDPERVGAAVRRTLERIWALFASGYVDPALDAIARAKALPTEQQERLATGARLRITTTAPLAGDKLTIVRWLVDHALVRGLAVPGIGKRDLFVALVEGFAHDDEIAAVMDRSRDWRAEGGNVRRQDQRKLMTRRSRLNGKRRQHGY